MSVERTHAKITRRLVVIPSRDNVELYTPALMHTTVTRLAVHTALLVAAHVIQTALVLPSMGTNVSRS